MKHTEQPQDFINITLKMNVVRVIFVIYLFVLQ